MDCGDLPISPLDEKPEDGLGLLHDTLMYLLGNIEILKCYLPYNNILVPAHCYSADLPTLMKECEPFLVYLESAARSTYNNRKHDFDTLERQLLDMSELLVKYLEHLSLLYSSFGLISLDDTDAEGLPAVLCGRFYLGANCQISIFRYFMHVPYSPNLPTLYKRLRWNVEITEETAEGSVINTKYYFLCCSEEPIVGVSELIYAFHGAPGPSTSQIQMVWSIGQWVALDPAEGADIESWILCSQPIAYYNLLFIVGFHEPSHTAATNLLVEILSGIFESKATLQASTSILTSDTSVQEMTDHNAKERYETETP